jgi:CARDB
MRIILIAGLFIVSSTAAQNPQLPEGQKPGQLPAPKNLRVVTPPDLRVEELSLVSVIRDNSTKTINIQVRVQVKNYGGLYAGNSTVLAYIKAPSGTGSTKTLTESLPVNKINPRGAFIKVYTFRQSVHSFRPGLFDFWIKADGRNAVAESDETNNNSAVLQITVPST